MSRTWTCVSVCGLTKNLLEQCHVIQKWCNDDDDVMSMTEVRTQSSQHLDLYCCSVFGRSHFMICPFGADLKCSDSLETCPSINHTLELMGIPSWSYIVYSFSITVLKLESNANLSYQLRAVVLNRKATCCIMTRCSILCRCTCKLDACGYTNPNKARCLLRFYWDLFGFFVSF